MVTTQPFTVLIVFLILTICSHQLLTEHQNGDHSKIYPDKRDSLSASSLAQLSPSTSVSSSLQSLSPTRGRNCSSCMLLDDAKQRRIRSIKWQILNKLGFKNEPNITRRDNLEVPPLKDIIASSPIPLSPLSSLSTFSSPSSYHSSDPTIQYDTKRLHEMYSKDELMSSDQAYPNSEDYDDDSEDFYVNTDKAISFAMKPPENWSFLKGIKSQYFKFSPNVVNAHLASAHLWAFIQPKRSPGTGSSDSSGHYDLSRPINVTVVVYEVRKSREPVSLLNIRSKKLVLDGRKGRWVTLDIRRLVTERFRNSNGNFGLVIHAYDERGRSLHVTSPYDGENHSQRTFIELSTTTRKANRVRRETGLRCEEGSKEINCCLHPLTVDFEEFGWDWIIAPKRYEANFCSGECPYMFLQDNNHAHLVQQANPSMSTGPCCTPRKMSSISMLYYDDNNQIILGTLKGMKAERCGCA